MDKFAQDAFKKAEQQRLDAEETAWSETPKGTKAAVITASLLVFFPRHREAPRIRNEKRP